MPAPISDRGGAADRHGQAPCFPRLEIKSDKWMYLMQPRTRKTPKTINPASPCHIFQVEMTQRALGFRLQRQLHQKTQLKWCFLLVSRSTSSISSRTANSSTSNLSWTPTSRATSLAPCPTGGRCFRRPSGRPFRVTFQDDLWSLQLKNRALPLHGMIVDQTVQKTPSGSTGCCHLNARSAP